METNNDIQLHHYTSAEQALENADSAQGIVQDALVKKDFETARAVQEGQRLELSSALVHAILSLPNPIIENLTTEEES